MMQSKASHFLQRAEAMLRGVVQRNAKIGHCSKQQVPSKHILQKIGTFGPQFWPFAKIDLLTMLLQCQSDSPAVIMATRLKTEDLRVRLWMKQYRIEMLGHGATFEGRLIETGACACDKD